MPDAYENFNMAMRDILTASIIADDEDPYLPSNDIININTLSPYNGSQGNMSAASPMSTSSSPVCFSPTNYINLNNATVLGEPYIKILVQPIEKFRFRYKSEMVGTHGSLQGASLSSKRNKYNVPTVKLCNYMDQAIIRCTLVTSDEDNRILHAHRLVKRVNTEDIDDPHDILVSQHNNYVAEFMSMGIIHTARKHIKDEIVRKLRAELLEERRRSNVNATLSMSDDTKIKINAEQYQKSMNLNSVALCFQAFIKDEYDIMRPITRPVYSHPINNLKSALTGELKICRIDKYTSSCEGGEEVFIFVEKVAKKNIRIKFFELDENTSVEVWSDYGRFSELDVHHQYAMVFRTPPYKDLTITSPKEVFIQLERPSDLQCSNTIKFMYKPSDRMIGRKRTRVSDSNSGELAQMAGINRNTPSMINNAPSAPLPSMSSNNSEQSSDMSKELKEMLEERCSSSEFRAFFENISSEDLHLYGDLVAQSENLTYDGTRSKLANVTPKDEKVFANNTLCTVMKNIRIKPEKAKDIIRNSFKDRTTYGDTPLHCALRYEQNDTAKNIVKLISIVKSDAVELINIQNSSGKTPLHYAVSQNHPEITKALLMLGADANIADHCGQMPLHTAVMCPEGRENVDILLNEKTINIEANTDLGWTPLQLAAEAGSYHAVYALVKAGADVNSTDMSCGRTALHVAVEGGHKDIVKFLLENTKIDVNKRNFSGNTALHTAVVTQGSIAKQICALLMKHGADPHIKNYNHEPEISNIEENSEYVRIKTEVQSDDEDIEEERTTGQSSFDLASNKPDILQLVSGENTALLKETVECKEENIDDLEKVWMNTEQEMQLANILDKTKGWRKLVQYFDFNDLMSTFEQSSNSPSMLLLNCIAVQTNTPLVEFRNILETVGEEIAAEFIKKLLWKN